MRVSKQQTAIMTVRCRRVFLFKGISAKLLTVIVVKRQQIKKEEAKKPPLYRMH